MDLLEGGGMVGIDLLEVGGLGEGRHDVLLSLVHIMRCVQM